MADNDAPLRRLAEETIGAASDLLAAIGVGEDPYLVPEAFLDRIYLADPRYRGGRDLVRWQLLENGKLTGRLASLTETVSAQLGMRGPAQLASGHFAAIVVLGGALDINWLIGNWIASALAAGSIGTDELLFACAPRRLPPAERDKVRDFAPGAATEVDLCRAAATAAGRLTDTKIEVLVAEEISTPGVLLETYSHLSSAAKRKQPIRLALAARRRYCLSAKLDALRLQAAAKERFTIECCAYVGAGQQDQSPALYLSEILRTLRAAVFAWHGWGRERTKSFFDNQPQRLAELDRS